MSNKQYKYPTLLSEFIKGFTTYNDPSDHYDHTHRYKKHNRFLFYVIKKKYFLKSVSFKMLTNRNAIFKEEGILNWTKVISLYFAEGMW